VQIYDSRIGRFVHFKFVSSKAEAQREMARQRALGHRVKHVPVVHAARGPVGRRHQSRAVHGSSAKMPIQRVVTVHARKIDPQIAALQEEVSRLRRQLGTGGGEALPASVVRCEQLIKRLKARLA
jgi:hypothetical protein